MTIEIELTRGAVALIDDDDYEIVAGHYAPWHLQQSHAGLLYARTNVRKNGGWAGASMHTFITGWPYVDHISGDGLDNRRSNLRQATHAENVRNRRTYKNNTSGFKGVSLVRTGGKWKAQIELDGRNYYLGVHATPEEAARAYDEAAIEMFGEYARTNFPREEIPT